MLNENNWRIFRPDLENPQLDDVMDAYRGFNLLPVPWVESEDVANALLFLASDEARYVTGVAFPSTPAWRSDEGGAHGQPQGFAGRVALVTGAPPAASVGAAHPPSPRAEYEIRQMLGVGVGAIVNTASIRAESTCTTHSNNAPWPLPSASKDPP